MQITKHDLAGGLLAALIGLPQAIVLGIVVFSPINAADAIELGVRAGIIAVIVGGIVAAFAGGAPLLITGPRASAALILASLVKELSEALGPAATPDLLSWLFLSVLLAGVLQLAFAAVGADKLIRRIPEPVAANFTLIIGLIIIFDQLRPMLLGEYGKRPSLLEIPGLLSLAQPGASLLGLLPLALLLVLMYQTRFGEKRIGKTRLSYANMAPLFGLIAGIALFQLLQLLHMPGLGKSLADVAKMTTVNAYLGNFFHLLPTQRSEDIALIVILHAALLALMGTLDTLIAAANLEAEFDEPFQARRELLGQGIANICCAIAGGIAVTGSLQRGKASADLGARHASAGLASALFILLMVTVAWPVFKHVPLPVLATVLAATGIQMVKGNSGKLIADWRHWRANRKNTDALTNLLTAAFMLSAVLLLGAKLIWVTLGGVLINIAGLLYKLSGKVIFRTYTHRERHSMELRSAENRQRLAEAHCDVKIIELEGDIFFGTAIDLREQIDNIYSGANYGHHKVLILDFSRVHEMDDTGTKMLLQIVRRLEKKCGVEVWLSYIGAEENCHSRRQQLRRAGLHHMCPLSRWQIDTDHALEAIEDAILAHHADEWKREVAFAELAFCRDLPERERIVLHGYFEPTHHYAKGDYLFRQSEAADGLYVIAKGDIKLLVENQCEPNASSTKRIAELNPGAIFGSDVLHPHGKMRIASAVVREDCSVWQISRVGLANLEVEHPALAMRIYRSAAAEFSDRISAMAKEAGMADAF